MWIHSSCLFVACFLSKTEKKSVYKQVVICTLTELGPVYLFMTRIFKQHSMLVNCTAWMFMLVLLMNWFPLELTKTVLYKKVCSTTTVKFLRPVHDCGKTLKSSYIRFTLFEPALTILKFPALINDDSCHWLTNGGVSQMCL